MRRRSPILGVPEAPPVLLAPAVPRVPAVLTGLPVLGRHQRRERHHGPLLPWVLPVLARQALPRVQPLRRALSLPPGPEDPAAPSSQLAQRVLRLLAVPPLLAVRQVPEVPPVPGARACRSHL